MDGELALVVEPPAAGPNVAVLKEDTEYSDKL